MKVVVVNDDVLTAVKKLSRKLNKDGLTRQRRLRAIPKLAERKRAKAHAAEIRRMKKKARQAQFR
jgi:ribosomal protein S21